MTDEEKIIIKEACKIIYNNEKAIALLESIGIRVEGNNSDNDIGGNIYSSYDSAYSIIKSIMEKYNVQENDLFDIFSRFDSSEYLHDNEITNKMYEALIASYIAANVNK